MFYVVIYLMDGRGWRAFRREAPEALKHADSIRLPNMPSDMPGGNLNAVQKIVGRIYSFDTMHLTYTLEGFGDQPFNPTDTAKIAGYLTLVAGFKEVQWPVEDL